MTARPSYFALLITFLLVSASVQADEMAPTDQMPDTGTRTGDESVFFDPTPVPAGPVPGVPIIDQTSGTVSTPIDTDGDGDIDQTRVEIYTPNNIPGYPIPDYPLPLPSSGSGTGIEAGTQTPTTTAPSTGVGTGIEDGTVPGDVPNPDGSVTLPDGTIINPDGTEQPRTIDIDL